ncbi:MAG: histidine phosphatase family protein [Promethearchaeota archaeon]
MNKFEKIWKNGKWTEQARDLIEGLKKFPENAKIVLILRHSHRKTSVDPHKLSSLKLTPQGHEIAKIFGKNLPKNRKVRLFHSIVERCKETAEGILEGFKEIGGKGEIVGTLQALYDIGEDSIFIIQKAIEHSGDGFLAKWASGKFSRDKIKPLDEYSQYSAIEIWGLCENAPEGCLDIHVSHDLSIMGFRLGWFGLENKDYWVSFLGGFAFSIYNDKIKLWDRGRMLELDIPDWWKNR